MAVGDQIPVGRAKDIRGQIFGPFTVLYRCEYKNDRPYWKVKCNNCGTESIKRGADLIKNKNLTCQECGKIDNKAGQKFGLLTVTKDWKRKNNSIYWKCICECGKETWVSTGNLTSGQTKSCGCLSKQNRKIKREKREKEWAKLNPGDKIPVDKAKDLTGKKFKRLTALYRCIPPESYSKKERSAFWMCRCDCGKHVIVSSYQLQYGTTYSCGCYNKELSKQKLKKMHENYRQKQIDKYKNKKFGLLTALYPLENSTNRYMTWHCKCECGRELDMSTQDLFRKYSCGCIQGSNGEQKIHHYLFNKNITFEREKTFDNCLNLNTNMNLRFDFYLPDYNCCIEYDGEQHFKESSMCNDSLEDRQMRDQIKTQYCKNNDIKLIRIPYTQYDNIETILDKELLQLTEAK